MEPTGIPVAITSTESDGDRLLLAAARQGGWWLALLGAASLAGAAAQVLLPAVIGRSIDAILAGNAASSSPAGPLTACAILVTVIVGCGAVTDLATGVSGATATARLRRLLAGHVVAVGPGLLTSATRTRTPPPTHPPARPRAPAATPTSVPGTPSAASSPAPPTRARRPRARCWPPPW